MGWFKMDTCLFRRVFCLSHPEPFFVAGKAVLSLRRHLGFCFLFGFLLSIVYVVFMVQRRGWWATRANDSFSSDVGVLSDVATQQGNNKHMTEEETRELIARQRSALYGEGTFADKAGYIDETGNIRTGAPGPSGPASLRGHSPLAYDSIGRVPADVGTPGSGADLNAADLGSRPQSTTSPQTTGPTNKVFDNAVGSQSRTSTSSPTNASPPRGDFGPGSKVSQGAAVAPIGTRPTGTPTGNASAKRSSTPHAANGGWGRGNGVWGQSSGLGAQASVWG